MARHPYDHDHGRRGYDRHSFGLRGYQMDPGWGWDEGGDPNYRGGEYQGNRMRGDGRHDLPDGWYDGRGYYPEAGERGGGRPQRRFVPNPRREAGPPMSGGVRY